MQTEGNRGSQSEVNVRNQVQRAKRSTNTYKEVEVTKRECITLNVRGIIVCNSLVTIVKTARSTDAFNELLNKNTRL